MARRVVNPPELKDSQRFKYNHAIVEDGRLYTSGQVGMDAESNVVGDDVESQARKAFENLGVLLDAVGKDYSDIAKVTSYVVDIRENRDGYAKVYREFVEQPYPCHTMLGVEALAFPEYLCEVEVDLPVDDQET